METTHTTRPIPLRAGGEIPAGARVEWGSHKSTIHASERSYMVRTTTAAHAAGYDRPDHDQLSEWVYDSVCESVTGDRVEPDGYGPDGAPSWLLALGMI